jgi:hypothetical protein
MEDESRSVYTVDASDQRICDKVEAMIWKFLLLLVYELGVPVDTVFMLITRCRCKFYLKSLSNHNAQKRHYFKVAMKIWSFLNKEDADSNRIRRKLTVGVHICQDRKLMSWGFKFKKTLIYLGDCIIFNRRVS